jgi:hypothetical protein
MQQRLQMLEQERNEANRRMEEANRLIEEKSKRHRLPSRDFPNSMLDYTNDEEIKANYIPKSNISSDYVRDKEIITEKLLKEYEETKIKINKIDLIISELQTPIFIAILFFVFQMPIVNTMIFKKFSFLSITNEEGNYNMNGYIFKSVLFSFLYYITVKLMKYIVDY